MPAKEYENRKERWLKNTIIALVIIIVVGLVSALLVRQAYNNNLKARSGSQQLIIVKVPSGASAKQIGDKLEQQQVIKQSWAFNWYVRSNQFIEKLKAGTYALRPSQSVPEIVDVISQGEVATDLATILPGQRIDQIEASLINQGFDPDEVKEALKPEHYKGHPALVDKPKNASLEGYLYPESFQKTAETNPQDIIRQSLDEMAKRLTPSLRKAIARRGLSVHEGITLASIVEQEVSDKADKPVVAGVFYNRLNSNMFLESDVTVLYGAIINGEQPSLTYDSKYNTFTHKGLPPGPISNVSEDSLSSVAHPKTTNYLFFVAGDDGETYFSKTLEGHEKNVKEHCSRLCR